MTPQQQEIANKLVELLRPLKGTGANYYDDDEYPDRVGPDQPIREVVRQALAELDIDDLGGCRLCLS